MTGDAVIPIVRSYLARKAGVKALKQRADPESRALRRAPAGPVSNVVVAAHAVPRNPA